MSFPVIEPTFWWLCIRRLRSSSIDNFRKEIDLFYCDYKVDQKGESHCWEDWKDFLSFFIFIFIFMV